MTKRDKVMAIIAAEVANEGRVTKHAIRLYVENRLSAKAFQEAVNHGQKMRDHNAVMHANHQRRHVQLTIIEDES